MKRWGGAGCKSPVRGVDGVEVREGEGWELGELMVLEIGGWWSGRGWGWRWVKSGGWHGGGLAMSC